MTRKVRAVLRRFSPALFALAAACSRSASSGSPRPAPGTEPPSASSSSGAAGAPGPAASAAAPSPSGSTPPAAPDLHVAAETSEYGHFELESPQPADGAALASCALVFTNLAGKRTRLFSSPCVGEWEGVNRLGRTDHLGWMTFPASRSGTEFHLFQIAAALGGNALMGTSFWAVVVRPDNVWATPETFAPNARLEVAALPPGVNPTLVLDEPATTTHAGARYTVAFGSVSREELAKLPSRALGKEKKTLTGVLRPPTHASNSLWSIDTAGARNGDPGKESIRIEETTEACSPKTFDTLAESRIELTAEVTTWDDGRSVLKCLSVRRAQGD